jgi:hypothetical protein
MADNRLETPLLALFENGRDAMFIANLNGSESGVSEALLLYRG